MNITCVTNIGHPCPWAPLQSTTTAASPNDSRRTARTKRTRPRRFAPLAPGLPELTTRASRCAHDLRPSDTPTRRCDVSVNRRSQSQDLPACPRRVFGRRRTRGPLQPAVGPFDRRGVLPVTTVTISGRPVDHTRRNRLHRTGGLECGIAKASPRGRSASGEPAHLAPRQSTAEHQPKPSLGRTGHPEGRRASPLHARRGVAPLASRPEGRAARSCTIERSRQSVNRSHEPDITRCVCRDT